MKLCIVVCLFLSVLYSVRAERWSSALDLVWNTWKVKYSKQYESPEQESIQRSKWEQNYARVQEHNGLYANGKKTYTMSLNKFSDLDDEEFSQLYLKSVGRVRRIHSPNVSEAKISTAEIPDALDWRKHGIVTPVKDQGQCGGCWSFGATGAMEGQYALKTKRLLSFSEQQLMDCSLDFGNQGCDGGLEFQAYEYAKEYGIQTEASYPYEAKDGTCRYQPSKIVTKTSGYYHAPIYSESGLKETVARRGPASVGIDAERDFRHYSQGVFVSEECDAESLNHSVLVVGYGTQDGIEYWLVKNSWGIDWGDSGYIKIARNHDNMCGIATDVTVPEL